MSKATALYQWFSSFGLTAYEESNVKVGTKPPYLTYTYKTGEFGGGEVALVVNLLYQTDSNVAPDAKAEEIYARIGRGGVTIPVGDGAIWLKRGSPFVQAISDPADANIRRRYINITAEFLTA